MENLTWLHFAPFLGFIPDLSWIIFPEGLI